MSFSPAGPSVRLAVTDSGQTANLTGAANAMQCRIWNEGPNAARVRYGTGPTQADETDMIIPPGLVETHTKFNNTVLAAKCATGETAVLHVIAGTGD